MGFSLQGDVVPHGMAAVIVAVVLLAMDWASLTVFMERLIALRRSRKQSRQFAALSGSHLRADTVDTVIAEADKFPGGHLPRLVKAALSHYRHAHETADASTLRCRSGRAGSWSAISKTWAPNCAAGSRCWPRWAR